jgi:hypothetical protein
MRLGVLDLIGFGPLRVRFGPFRVRAGSCPDASRYRNEAQGALELAPRSVTFIAKATLRRAMRWQAKAAAVNSVTPRCVRR